MNEHPEYYEKDDVSLTTTETSFISKKNLTSSNSADDVVPQYSINPPEVTSASFQETQAIPNEEYEEEALYLRPKVVSVRRYSLKK